MSIWGKIKKAVADRLSGRHAMNVHADDYFSRPEVQARFENRMKVYTNPKPKTPPPLVGHVADWRTPEEAKRRMDALLAKSVMTPRDARGLEVFDELLKEHGAEGYKPEIKADPDFLKDLHEL